MKTKQLIVSLFLTVLAVNAHSDELQPFTSDGCSSFPDGTFKQKKLWLNCCEIHDKAYWQGGTSDQRLIADQTLKECVAKVGKPKIAKLMLAGVRVGGSPYWPTNFRWGYGWSFPRNYGELNQQENQQVGDRWKIYLLQIKNVTNGDARQPLTKSK